MKSHRSLSRHATKPDASPKDLPDEAETTDRENVILTPALEEAVVHITTGTHVAQICLFLLTESRHLPGRLIQTSPPSERQPRHLAEAGEYSIIDLDLSRYNRIAARFAEEQREALTFLKNGIATRNTAFNRMIEETEHVWPWHHAIWTAMLRLLLRRLA